MFNLKQTGKHKHEGMEETNVSTSMTDNSYNTGFIVDSSSSSNWSS